MPRMDRPALPSVTGRIVAGKRGCGMNLSQWEEQATEGLSDTDMQAVRAGKRLVHGDTSAPSSPVCGEAVFSAALSLIHI